MNNKSSLIPKEFQIKPLSCDEYLVNGVIEKWKGKTSELESRTTGNKKIKAKRTAASMNRSSDNFNTVSKRVSKESLHDSRYESTLREKSTRRDY